MWVEHNENPYGKLVGDCTIRAISTALGQDWDTTSVGLWVASYMQKDMPSANAVWGAYLRQRGWKRHTLPESCPDCYTVADFAADHSSGTYILSLPSHVLCVKDGNLYDTWNSGDETPLYFWSKEE